MTTREERQALSAPGLYERAVHLAMRRMDVGFLWGLLRDPPEAGNACLSGTGPAALDVTRVLGYLQKDTR